MHRTHLSFLAIAVSLLSGVEATKLTAEPVVGPPQGPCEIRRQAWCFMLTSSVIEYMGPSRQFTGLGDEVVTRWTMRALYNSPEQSAVILEPVECNRHLADTFELVSFEDNYRWRDENWIRVKVRFLRSGACDVDFMAPNSQRDTTLSSFFAILTSVKSCSTAGCYGEFIGSLVSDDVVRSLKIKAEQRE